MEPYWERLRILTCDRLILALFVATLLAVGVEAGTTGILSTFLAEHRGLAGLPAQLGLALFLIGIAIGRLLVGYFTRNEHVRQVLIVLFGLSALVYAGLYFLDVGALTYVMIFLAGLTLSAMVPVILTLAGLLHPEMAGTVLGAIKVAIPIGGIVLPFLMSVLSQQAGLAAGLAIYPVAFVLGAAMLAPSLRRSGAAGTQWAS